MAGDGVMFALRILAYVFALYLVLFGCAAGCNVPVDPPAIGEEGGECFADGTCKQGLECVESVCVVEDGGGSVNTNGEVQEVVLLIFHNNNGPMCLEALFWLHSVELDSPELVVEEHLTYESGESDLMWEMASKFETSQGVSSSFGYLPIIFVEDRAFSGFDDDVAAAIQALLLGSASVTS